MWQDILAKAESQIIQGCLYSVATPIGNLADISLRALAILRRADLVCAEDTRVSQQLLRAYGINSKLLSVREHNEQQMAERVIVALREGQIVAQISDAGTPAICDPGARLVSAVREAGFRVIPVVGASALIGALSVAGVTNSSFYFAGFLPAKAQERRQLLQSWQNAPHAIAMFETPHRIEATIAEMSTLYPERRLIVARELTKAYETIWDNRIDTLAAIIAADRNQSRGELVLILHPSPAKLEPNLDGSALRTMALLAAELPLKQAANLAASITGSNKKALYDWALQQKRQKEGEV